MDIRGTRKLCASIGTVTLLLSACISGFERSEVNLKITNNTNSLICYYPNLPEATARRFCEEVNPQGERSSSRECGPGDNADLTGVAVVLTVGLGGEVIYNRTATCREWNDSGLRITIDRRDGEFLVTDNLPEPTPSP